MKYKHIIWDWNGTLIDDAWLCVDIMNKILEKRNLDFNNHR
jgi:phosphoglycolate phosphatase